MSPTDSVVHHILSEIEALARLCRAHGLSAEADRFDQIGMFGRLEAAGEDQISAHVVESIPSGFAALLSNARDSRKGEGV